MVGFPGCGAVPGRGRRRRCVPGAVAGAPPPSAGRCSGTGAYAGEAAKEEDIATLPESGRGIDIMRACVDDVSMTSGPEHRTVVSLSKRLAWRPGAPFADAVDDELEDGQLADAG